MDKLKSLLKQWYLRRSLRGRVTFGSGVAVSRGVTFGRKIRVGNGTSLGLRVHLNDNVRVGENVRLQQISVGTGSFIDANTICTGQSDGEITIGSQTYIGLNNILDWSGDLSIGSHVHVAGPSTGFWTHTTAYQALHGDDLKDNSRLITAPVVIEDNVYIGGNCTVYPNVRIGHHSIILPNSAVAKDVEPYTMVGGVPAKLIRRIDPKEIEKPSARGRKIT